MGPAGRLAAGGLARPRRFRASVPGRLHTHRRPQADWKAEGMVIEAVRVAPQPPSRGAAGGRCAAAAQAFGILVGQLPRSLQHLLAGVLHKRMSAMRGLQVRCRRRLLSALTSRGSVCFETTLKTRCTCCHAGPAAGAAARAAAGAGWRGARRRRRLSAPRAGPPVQLYFGRQPTWAAGVCF